MTKDGQPLIDRAAGGDVEALRTLFERYGPQVWAAIDADIGPPWRSLLDADDVMQVTYMEAFLRIDQLTARDTLAFVGWLRRIAQNNLRDAIKELDRQKRPSPGRRIRHPVGEDSSVSLIEMLGATTTTPSRHFAQREAAEAVDFMLRQLPPDYACVIRLYDLDGRDIADVAQSMNRSPGAVHMLRARAHDRLRALLGTAGASLTRTA